MDQSDVAATAGFIGAPITAALLAKVTDWPVWVTVPVGLVGGFVLSVVVVLLAVEIAARIIGSKRGGNGDD